MRHAPDIAKKKGFTFVEVLIVIGIIGFLAAAILIAIDPVRRMQDSRDAQRWDAVTGLMNAVLTKQVNDRALYDGAPSDGIVHEGITGNVQVIVSSDVGIDCTSAAKRPGCNLPMDTSGVDTCIADLSGTSVGKGTLNANASATVEGTGTAFLSEVKMGDKISDGAATCIVAGVAGDTTLTCRTPVSYSNASFTIARAGSSIAPAYIAAIPTDPAGGTPCATGSGCTTEGDVAIGPSNSGYYIARTTGNHIEIGACKPEQAPSISMSR